MKLLANENFPYKSIYYLKAKGYDVLSIGIDNPGVKDSEVMTIAINEERTILTFDRDYGELIFRHNYKPEKGVIYLRLDEYKPDEPGLIVEEIILNKEIDLSRALTVVDKKWLTPKKVLVDELRLVCCNSGQKLEQRSFFRCCASSVLNPCTLQGTGFSLLACTFISLISPNTLWNSGGQDNETACQQTGASPGASPGR